ncbi:MAG: DUF4337 family protein [Actinomycetota bacterium]|nr:DUF4337 family protein [Actinomycetota bacterium]
MTGYGEPAEIAADLTLEDVSEPVPNWYRGVALTILVLSIITAIAALLAALSAHQTLLDRTEEIIGVAITGDDQLTIDILRTKHELQAALGEEVSEQEVERVEKLEDKIRQLTSHVAGEDTSARTSVTNHLVLSIAATIAAIAIAVTGLAPIVHKRWLWAAGVFLGVVAIGFLAYGVIRVVT